MIVRIRNGRSSGSERRPSGRGPRVITMDRKGVDHVSTRLYGLARRVALYPSLDLFTQTDPP
jgi:hypothetical protein